ncbi:hypothetical protein BDW22DRAFT_765350 [Trametopsis cervina]|nr:hypothetical protein BDW22DRAFT_765350 [Trametopsis cervina]
MTESRAGNARLHVEMFPCHRSPSQQILDELKDQLNLGMYDHITSQNSIFPYDKDESADSLRCIKKIRPNEENATGIWIVARCKQNLIQHAFLNYFGERGARIHRTDSVLEKSLHKPRSWFFCILTPFLFFMPSVYMEEIDNVWIDETVDSINWRRFITMLTRDWEHSITPATVILSANVGFLAIQSIDVNSPHRTAAQIASYISGVLALFNYIVCQVLARHHRHSDHFATHKAGEFLERRQSQWLGLESVAITFSLPTALFIWSMLTFLVALMIVFFWQTSLATRVSLGAVLVFMFSLTAILLWLDWESHKEFPWKSMLYRICPSGLCTTVLHVRESWQVTSRFRLRRKKGSSIGSDTSTAVNSDRSLGPL